MNYLYSTAYFLIIAIGFAQIIQVIADDVYSRISPAQPNNNIHIRGTTSKVNGGGKTVPVSTHTIEFTPRPSPSSPVTDLSVLASKSTIVTPPLPDDDASFESIREQGCIYVDKTETLEYLLKRGTKLFFFTRPRRFGKSIFVKMMKSFFRGQWKLFDSLKISEHGNIVHDKKIKLDEISSQSHEKWLKYPVIHLSFGQMIFKVSDTDEQKLKQFENNLEDSLKRIARNYDVDSTQPAFRLTTLIEDLYNQFKLRIIILIDEYDAPVNTAIYEELDTELATGIANILNRLFTEIKDNTEYLRFVWVTGVMKLGLTALQSGPNSFVDVTLTKELAVAVGFTAEEMTSYFESHIELFCNAKGKHFTQKKMMKKLIEMYDGYRFSIDSDMKVFNPVSIINSLKNKRLDSYWQATSSSTYIIRRMWEECYTISSFENIKHSREFLFQRRNPINEMIPLVVYMLLTGYLRIDHYDKENDKCELTYANKETKEVILNGMRNYIPSEKKLFGEVNWLTPGLRSLMSNPNPNITELIGFLNRIGFPPYYVAVKGAADEEEVIRRLLAILRTASLVSFEPYQFFFPSGDPAGDNDIVTAGLPINYVIEIKCGKGKKASSAMDGIKQQIKYATETEEKRTSFLEALSCQDRLYLLTLHFEEQNGGMIDEWVFLPLTGGRLRFDKLEASSNNLFHRVKNMVLGMKIDKNYIEDF